MAGAAPPALTEHDLRETHRIFMTLGGSVRGTARLLGIQRSSVRKRLEKAQKELGLEWKAELAGGRVEARKAQVRPLPAKGKVAHYIITSAQNNTYAHYAFWDNLVAYAEHLGAEILVSQFTYNKTRYGRKSVKPGSEPTADDVADLWYDDVFDEHIANDPIELAPMLLYCGEQNTLPTDVRPLSGLQTYTGPKSGIFPHAKMAMESVPSLKEHGAKLIYTTGTATARNYIQKKAGLKAEFHHTYGALHVEVDSNGNWFVRQLNATDDGAFQDLDIIVKDQEVEGGFAVEGINWGDVHVEQMDPVIREMNWGEGGILDTLQPRHQIMHDTVDFYRRNHHKRHDPHKNFELWHEGCECVETEMRDVATFLTDEAARPFCKTVVVDSNHDNALLKWLREGDYRTDPVNALFFLKTQTAVYEAIKSRDSNFHVVEHVLRSLGVPKGVKFLRDDDSYVIARSIECGMHGHLGPNGARGNPRNLSMMGRKANTGHTHSAQIIDGMYVAGTCSLLSLDYNKGPSSWSHSHVVTYQNGKRAIITVYNGKWRA